MHHSTRVFHRLLYFFGAASILILAACAGVKNRKAEQGWISLFNGKDLSDWIVKIHHHEPGDNYGNTLFQTADRRRCGQRFRIRYEARWQTAAFRLYRAAKRRPGN